MKSAVYRLPFALSVVFASMISGFVHAEDDNFDVMGDMSLQDLFAIDTDIAGNTSRDVTEQPSIISVINRDQIINSGARDLIDILRLVPGIGFAHDTVGINSIGFRGIWGHEGKIMLMIDGAPYNDPAWGNLQLGKHYPVQLIKKIEIIRGPGAAKYGNYAELAMIKITTIGEEMEGGYVASNVRTMDSNFGSGELTAMYGNQSDNGWGYSTSLHVKNANRTDIPFQNADSTISTYQDYSPIHVVSWDGKVRYKDFEVTAVSEQYNFEHSESLLQVPDPNMVMDNGYDRFHLGGDLRSQVSDSWKINANVLYQKVMSHDMVVKESRNFDLALGSHYRIETERTIGSFDAMWTISENDSLNFGVEYFRVDAEAAAIGEYFVDPGHNIEGDSTDFRAVWFDGFTRDTYEFNQKSIFVQYENYNDIVNFTVGYRFADHSRSSEKVGVPRIGLSKKWGNFGVKAMYSEAFRTGDAEHLNLASTQLKPETLKSKEVEFSYLHDSGLYTINFFKMDIADSIVWNTDALTENKGELATSGFEASWRGKGKGYEQEFNIAHYEAGDQSSLSQLAYDNKSFLGFPTYKATWRLDYEFSEKINLTPSVMYENEKWWRVDLADSSKDKKIDAVFKINLAMTYKMNDAMDIQLAVHDLLNDGYQFLQAYGQVNYPGDGREFSLSLQYIF